MFRKYLLSSTEFKILNSFIHSTNMFGIYYIVDSVLILMAHSGLDFVPLLKAFEVFLDILKATCLYSKHHRGNSDVSYRKFSSVLLCLPCWFFVISQISDPRAYSLGVLHLLFIFSFSFICKLSSLAMT